MCNTSIKSVKEEGARDQCGCGERRLKREVGENQAEPTAMSGNSGKPLRGFKRKLGWERRVERGWCDLVCISHRSAWTFIYRWLIDRVHLSPFSPHAAKCTERNKKDICSRWWKEPGEEIPWTRTFNEFLEAKKWTGARCWWSRSRDLRLLSSLRALFTKQLDPTERGRGLISEMPPCAKEGGRNMWGLKQAGRKATDFCPSPPCLHTECKEQSNNKKGLWEIKQWMAQRKKVQ